MHASVTAAGRWHPTVISACPNTVLGFVGLMSLLLIARFGSMAALVFLIATVVLMLRNPAVLVVEARQNLLLWLIAVWALASVMWSAYPDLTLRYGVQLMFTFVFTIGLASRVAPLVFLKIAVVCYSVIGVGGLLVGRVRSDGGGWLGLFNSKNAFAGASGFMVIACMAVLLDRRFSGRARAAAGAGCALGLFLVVKGQSVGALIALAVALGGMMAVLLLRWVKPLTRLLFVFLMLLSLILLLLAIVSWSHQFAALVLDVTGKDVTLTGRTYLWEIALAEIERQPWLGQGFQAVWVIGNPLAEQLWLEFGIETKIGFHFHNTYISNAVELGILGVGLQTVVFLGAFFILSYWAIMDPRAETIFLAGVMLRQLVLSMSEVVFFFQFDATTVLTVAAVVYAGRYLRTPHHQPVSSFGTFPFHPRLTPSGPK